MGASGFNLKQNDFPTAAPAGLTVTRVLFFVLSVLAVFSMPRLLETGKLSGHAVGSYSPQWVVLLVVTGILALACLGILALLLSQQVGRLVRFADAVIQRLARFGWLNLAGFTASWLIYVLLVLWRYQKHFAQFLPQVWLFGLIVALGAVFIAAFFKKLPYFWAFIITAVLYGAGVKALGYLPEVTTFPFSISWSEGSRYYYAALPYSNLLFGERIPLAPWHASRYLLQSIAFWLPNSPILVHRLWQVILWLALSLGTGLALVRRFKFDFRMAFVLAVWAALFVLQGPVYYHLEVCVILVLLGFDRRHFWKTLIFVGLASIWAGLSRINWAPVPAFLAIALYIMERPVCESGSLRFFRAWLDYLWRPAAWGVVGGALAFAAQAGYILVSGQPDKSVFGSSFTSALLWYRLFPSPTYKMGVLAAILLVTAPLLVLFIVNAARSWRAWHPLRLFGLAAMTLVLLVGGLVVSTKIGGGSNIHNLDAYIVMVLVLGTSVWLGHYQPETASAETATAYSLWRPWLLTLAIIAIPVIWNLRIGDPFIRRDFAQANYDLGKLTEIVKKHAAEGEVLFITQRQVEVFHMIPGVRMVPDYELMTLTEMSMSNNQAYLNRFYNDLRNHRFSLIVADQQSSYIKNPEKDSFAEENNAWATNVSNYIKMYYQSELFFDTQGIDTLVPRP